MESKNGSKGFKVGSQGDSAAFASASCSANVVDQKAVGWQDLPNEMHRLCLDFTTPGFAPLKRVSKMFKSFEERQERIDAVAAMTANTVIRVDVNSDHSLPYVTSDTLVEWAHREMQMPMDIWVCRAAASVGNIKVLKWIRA